MNEDNKMTWAILVPLIIQYGLPFTIKMFELWSKGNPPTLEELNALQELAKLKAVDLMKAILYKTGIDPESDQGKALLLAATTV